MIVNILDAIALDMDGSDEKIDSHSKSINSISKIMNANNEVK